MSPLRSVRATGPSAMIQKTEQTKMSYDKYWDCPSLDPKTWIEYLAGTACAKSSVCGFRKSRRELCSG